MANRIGFVALLLCGCLAVSAVAEDAGDSVAASSRRRLQGPPPPPPPPGPPQCAPPAKSGDWKGFVKCCHGEKIPYVQIVDLCKPLVIKFKIKVTIELIVGLLGPESGPPKHHPPFWYPPPCQGWLDSRQAKKFAQCCHDNNYKDVHKIFSICAYYDIEIDINIIIGIVLGSPLPTPHGPPHPKACWHWGYQKDYKNLAICCYKGGITVPETIYEICQGYGIIDISIEIIIDVIVTVGYKPPHPPPHHWKPPPECDGFKHDGHKYVSCCKKLKLPPVEIIDVCNQVGLVGISLDFIASIQVG